MSDSPRSLRNKATPTEAAGLSKPAIYFSIQLAVIATLGRFTMEFMFEEFDLDQPEAKISELHGQQLTAKGLNGETTVIPLFHPAVALYNQGKR